MLRSSEWAILLYFSYAAAVGLALPLRPPIGMVALVVNLNVVTGTILLAHMHRLRPRPFWSVLRDWWPLPLMLLGYRQMGWFALPKDNIDLESAWVAWDRWLLNQAGLKAAVELGRRSMAAPLTTGTRLSCSADLFKHFHPALRDLKREIFKVVLLDAKNTVTKETTVSEGSLTLSVVHPREVFALAVRESAAAVIFLHNHPSGDPTPSPEDRQLTDRLVAAGTLLGIRVLDHVIIGDGRYVSFADEGWLNGQGAYR